MVAREQLVELWSESGLSAREFAAAIGVASSTVERHLAGRVIARERQRWYRRVKAIVVDGDEIHIIIRRTAPTRKNIAFWWRRGRVRDPGRDR